MTSHEQTRQGEEMSHVIDAQREKSGVDHLSGTNPDTDVRDSDENSTGALFRMVYLSAKELGKPQLMQIILTVLFTVILVGQVIWALWLIPEIIFNTAIIESANLSFISLLVTAILAEVVGMTFVVVRYVFKSPISELIDVLKELIKNNK